MTQTAEDYKLKVDTTVNPATGVIKINEKRVRQGFEQKLSTEIIKTKEDHIRKALVKLGWTPPIDDCLSHLREAVEELEKSANESISMWSGDTSDSFDSGPVSPKYTQSQDYAYGARAAIKDVLTLIDNLEES